MTYKRLQNCVPEIYVNNSRDFQLLCRLYDSIFLGVNSNIDTILESTETSSCNSLLLQLLASKVGFFDSKDIDDDALRYILDSFSFMLKNKGSKKAIKQAINVFLKINKIRGGSFIEIINKSKNSEEEYLVRIGVESEIRNTNVLDKMLKYILPTSYDVQYQFYKPLNISQTTQIADMDSFGQDDGYGSINILSTSLHADSLITEPSTSTPTNTNKYNTIGYSDILSIVRVYPHEEKFYADPQHTVLITPVSPSFTLYYFDQDSSKYYIYDGSSYKEITL